MTEITLSPDKLADLVRDAFYEGLERAATYEAWTESERFSAWMNSESLKQHEAATAQVAEE